ncbi:MAG: hypothetical protein AB1657_04800 [Candidatus Micrarchaeota archaeon]
MGPYSGGRFLRTSAMPPNVIKFTPERRKRDVLPPDRLMPAKVIDIAGALTARRSKELASVASSLQSGWNILSDAVFHGKGRHSINQAVESMAVSLSRISEIIKRDPHVLFLPANGRRHLMSDLAQLIKEFTQQKDKGAFRRAAEPPSDHWLLAWVVWNFYVIAMLTHGLKISEDAKRYEEFHQKAATRH